MEKETILKQGRNLKKSNAITLISLVVTIVILIILSSVLINITFSDNGIFNRVKLGKSEHEKQSATELMNLKITLCQMQSYEEKGEFSSLAYLAAFLNNDKETTGDIEYVEQVSKKTANLNETPYIGWDRLYTKLTSYPYEFEIDSSLKLASIDGIAVASANQTSGGSGNANVGGCTIAISEEGLISVSGVDNMKAFFVYLNNKFFDITKGTTYKIDNLPVGQNASIYIIATDIDGKLYKSNVQNYISLGSIANMTSGDLEISATVNLVENANLERTKYVFTTSNTALGTSDETLYSDGTVGQLNGTVKASKKAGTYYLHVLVVKENGTKKEIISKETATSQGKKDFNYTGKVQNITLTPGNYKLEVWGGQGGDNNACTGGKGGYSYGTITLNKITNLYTYVGGKGSYSSDYTVASQGGWNGGGSTGTNGSTAYIDGCGGGRRWRYRYKSKRNLK